MDSSLRMVTNSLIHWFIDSLIHWFTDSSDVILMERRISWERGKSALWMMTCICQHYEWWRVSKALWHRSSCLLPLSGCNLKHKRSRFRTLTTYILYVILNICSLPTHISLYWWSWSKLSHLIWDRSELKKPGAFPDDPFDKSTLFMRWGLLNCYSAQHVLDLSLHPHHYTTATP